MKSRFIFVGASSLNNLIKNKKDASDKYFFVTNNGRWTGFIDEVILKKFHEKKS